MQLRVLRFGLLQHGNVWVGTFLEGKKIVVGGRFGFQNLRHALASFLVEIGTDSKTIRDMLRWSDPSILLKVYAHSRMDKRMEARGNEKTAQQLIHSPWVIVRG